MKTGMTTMIAALLALVLSVTIQAEESAVPEAPADSMAATAEVAAPSEYLAVTYFHGDVRCATCKKLEAYSHEAIVEGFGDELESGAVVWRTVNYDQDDNKHYIDDYKLYTKALIVSRMRDTVEVEWVNLEKIWSLVGDKDDYLKYVQSEVRDYMNAAAEPEAAAE